MEERLIYLENIRKKAFTGSVIALTIAAIITGACAFFVITGSSIKTAMYIIVPLFALLYFAIVKISHTDLNIRRFKANYKAIFVGLPFQTTFGDITYDPENGFSANVIGQAGMIKLGNIYDSNDGIVGYYKDVKFARSDIEIKNRIQAGKYAQTVTYFVGRWLVFSFNKDFHFDLQLIGKGFQHSKKKTSILIPNNDRRHKIELEDVEFNQMFEILGQDDHEAYYILTPGFMSALKQMYHKLDGSVMLGFLNNQLHVAINTKKDAMEPSIYKSIKKQSILKEVQGEIDIIISVINDLDLDRDIYRV